MRAKSVNEANSKFINIDGYKLPIKMVSIQDWPDGKTDLTEYSDENNEVRIREDYDYIKDPIGWIRHEFMHWYLDQNGFEDDGKTYPYNNTEQKAYIHQFRYLKKKYNKIEDIPELKKDHHLKILKKYWDQS